MRAAGFALMLAKAQAGFPLMPTMAVEIGFEWKMAKLTRKLVSKLLARKSTLVVS